MRQFVRNVISFLVVPALILGLIAAVVPPTPKSRQSLLFAEIDKQRLLRETPPPRLVLIGGSNLSFGINSQMIEDQTGLHPINMAIQATLGLKYMLDSALPSIQPGDIVIVSLEYSQFFGRNIYGGEELLRIVMDVDRSKLRDLSYEQWLNIIRYLPKYAISKINPQSYIVNEDAELGIYERDSFNSFGDAVVHWHHKHSDFSPYPAISDPYNPRSIELLKDFQQALESRGATLLVTYPGLQDDTYGNMEDQIAQVQDVLQQAGFSLLGSPERYRMDELLMYNTPYHLNRQGVKYRTELLIEDLENSGVIRTTD